MASNLHTSDFRIALLFFCAIILGGLESASHASPQAPAAQLRFTQEPSDVVSRRNEQVLLNCSAESPDGAVVNITWWKDGLPVSDARRYVQPDGTLFIRRIKHKLGRSDEGLYSCHASSDQGSIVSRAALLQIASLDRFSEEPRSVRSPEGQLARFRCGIEGTPLPDITWEKDRVPLLPQGSLASQDGRIATLTSGVLHIQNVLPSDAGSYRCHARNVARDRHSIEANLTIIPNLSGSTFSSSPQLVTGPQDTTALLGSQVYLECAITGLLPPSSLPQQQQPQRVIWSRTDGQDLPVGRHVLIGRSNLQLLNLQLEDHGVYQCALLTTSGGASYTTSIAARANLNVLVPPKPIKSPEHIIRPTAHTARLTCEFEGLPEPSISWMRNGVPLQSGGRIKMPENNLLISQSVVSDSGFYQCVARNAVGQHLVNQLLSIERSENAPMPPSTLQISSISSRQVSVSWPDSPAVEGLSTFAYSIHYFPTDGGGAELQKVIEVSSVTIDQLAPFTNYTFYLVAYNRLGASSHSPLVYIVTGQDVPTAAPSCQLFATGARSLRVEWAELPLEQARGQISVYQVHYRKSGSNIKLMEEASGNLDHYSLTGLEANQRYDVRVLAGTSLGFPSLDDTEWPWVSQVTDPNLRSGVPEAPLMQLQALNSTALLVLWERPEVLGAELLGYKLAFRLLSDPAARTIILTGERMRHTLITLEPAHWYEVSLQGFNQLGDGDPAVASAQTLDIDAPGTALNMLPPPPPLMATMQAFSLNETAIRILWHKPLFDLAPITDYSVLVHPVKADGPISDSASAWVILTSETSIVLSDLEPFNLYEFKIRAHTAYTEGEYSGEIQCRTDEGKPSPPLNPEWSLQGPSVIQLQWRPPEHKNGIIVSYLILYCKECEAISTWDSKLENGSSTTAVVADLDTDAIYLFKLRAVTGRGAGPDSQILHVHTRSIGQNNSLRGNHGDPAHNEKRMGIIVGVCIGLGCIVICIAIVLLRNHCCPPLQPSSPVLAVTAAVSHPMENSAGTPPLHPQGNGEVLWSCQVLAPRHSTPPNNDHTMRDFQELDSFIPMLPPSESMPENKRSDTKGGTTCNGQVHGLVKLNGLRSNGHVKAAYLLMAADIDGAQVPLQQTQQQQNTSSPCSDYSSAGGHTCSLEEIDRSLNSDDLIMTEEGSSSGTETDPVVTGAWLDEDAEASTQEPLLSNAPPPAAEERASTRPQDPQLHVRV